MRGGMFQTLGLPLGVVCAIPGFVHSPALKATGKNLV